MRKLQAIKFHPCKFFERTPLKLSGFLLEYMQKNSFVKLAKYGNLLLTSIKRATLHGRNLVEQSLQLKLKSFALREPFKFVRKFVRVQK